MDYGILNNINLIQKIRVQILIGNKMTSKQQ